MDDMLEESKEEWSEDELGVINATINLIKKTLGQHEIRLDLGTSALLSLTAAVLTETRHTDDELVEIFKNCLLDARTNNCTQQ